MPKRKIVHPPNVETLPTVIDEAHKKECALTEDKVLEKKAFTRLELWKLQGLEIRFARFHTPVPPYLNHEPVSEFDTTKPPLNKYFVESMTYTPNGLVWKYKEAEEIIPLANVVYVRPAVSK